MKCILESQYERLTKSPNFKQADLSYWSTKKPTFQETKLVCTENSMLGSEALAEANQCFLLCGRAAFTRLSSQIKSKCKLIYSLVLSGKHTKKLEFASSSVVNRQLVVIPNWEQDGSGPCRALGERSPHSITQRPLLPFLHHG